MIIDGHTHAYLPEDIKILGQRLNMLDASLPDNDPNKWQFACAGDIDGLVEAQKQAHVDKMVLLPVTGKKSRITELNQWAADQAKIYPEIIPFGTLHPKGNFKEELETLSTLGLKGVKLHPFIQHFSLEDQTTKDLFSLLSETQLPVLTDTLSLKGLLCAKPHLEWVMNSFGFQGVKPSQIAQVAHTHPQMNIIAAHGGCLYGWDTLAPLMGLNNIYLDISYLNGLVEPALLLKIIREKGVEKIIYGTDAPWRSPLEFKIWFEDLGLSKMEKQAIQGGNLLGLLE